MLPEEDVLELLLGELLEARAVLRRGLPAGFGVNETTFQTTVKVYVSCASCHVSYLHT